MLYAASTMPSLLRSFLAIFVGYMVMMLVVIVLTLIFVKTMGLRSGHPTPGYLVANVIYSLLASAIGGFVTARLARTKPFEHTSVLAALIFLMGVLSYRHYSGQQPRWYQIMMMILLPVFGLAGGALFARNASSARLAPSRQ